MALRPNRTYESSRVVLETILAKFEPRPIVVSGTWSVLNTMNLGCQLFRDIVPESHKKSLHMHRL